MQLLVKDKHIIAFGEDIIFGVFESDGYEKWRVSDGQFITYYLDFDKEFHVEKTDAILPEDFKMGKYFFIDGAFVLNEDWKPLLSPEEKLALLEEKMNNLPSGGGDTDKVWDEMAVAIEEGVNEV